MIRPKLAICDSDAVYCHRLDEYLHGNLKLSFDIYSFTEVSILRDFAKNEEISLLIISEGLLQELNSGANKARFKNIMALDEGNGGVEFVEWSEDDNIRIEHVSKYQAASGIISGIIDICASFPEDFKGTATGSEGVTGNVLGFYTPISRCGQTTFARTMAKKLAERGKTIFLSFECFSSLPQLLGIQKDEDITDIMYYAECEKDKLSILLEKIKISKDGVDYIMPAKTAMQQRDISSEKLRNLLEMLTGEAGYEYVILDLTDYPEDFLDICLLCKKIFTVVRDSAGDAYRQKVFEEVLISSGYEVIKSRMVKIQLPDVRDKKAFNAYADQMLTGMEL